ncbi:LysR family transcriptional regulator [Altericroceibacterium xinjiangense]|uniref:LysR family transcriptional regulator n=1 Tax=Altericroceibacterium xinjiangense TaxID=762261 RepID=UPI000F7F5FB5|nr:LysR family transcriptional regulator [Altericroceibacterium xinjiangense]
MATARQLEIFVTVVKAGSMRRAADALGISQPSISRQLRALEKTVGGELFSRKRGEKARLSTLGTTLLHDARETLQHHDRFTRKNGHDATEHPVVFVRSFLLGQIKRQLPMLHERGLPRDVRFTVVDDSQDMAALVEAENGSLGVLRTDFLPTNDRIVGTLIRSETGSLYAAPGLAELINGEADIEKLGILVPAQQPGLEAYTSRLLARAGIGPEAIRPGSQFIELLLEDVLQGKGAAVFFDETVDDLVAQGRLVRLLDVSEPHYLVLLANKSVDQRTLTCVGHAFSKI